jgi:hypothetical protein
MLDVLEGNSHLLFGLDGARHCSLLREPYVAGVIPDLLIGRWQEPPAPLAVKSLTYVDAHIVAQVGKLGEVSTSALAEQVLLSRARLVSSSAKLVRAGVVSESVDGQLSIGRGCNSQAIDVVAVETKLRKWREALQQALSYRLFADCVYVVLDGNQASVNSGVVNAFECEGVGLYLQKGDELELLSEASRTEFPLSPERVLAAHKLLCCWWSNRPIGRNVCAISQTRLATPAGALDLCEYVKLLPA